MSRSGSSFWTEDELVILKAHPELDAKELCSLLPTRTNEGILQKRIKLGLDYKAKKWSKAQDAYLMSHRHDSAEDVGVALNRAATSVMVRRQEIGGRRLTLCHKCGTEIPKRNQHQTCPACAKTTAEMNAQPSARFSQYKFAAKRRDYSFELDFEQFMTFYEKDCAYCGEAFDGVGIDRVDNSIGYTLENTVSCCEMCNRMKLDHDMDTWLLKMKKIIANMGETA